MILRSRRVLLFLVSGAIIAGITYFFFRPEAPKKVVESEEVLRARDKEIMDVLIASSPMDIDEFCDSSGDCFIVRQNFWRRRHSGERMHARRDIVYKDRQQLVMSLAELKIPALLTTRHVDPRAWRVNHAILVFIYNAIQAAAGFITGSLTVDNPTKHQRILQIGMGGGASTSFLARAKLNLSIDVVELEEIVHRKAVEHFDFTKSSRVTVHIEDGVKFLQREVKKGSQYDSILLDACSNRADTPVVCPAAVFLDEDVLKLLSQAAGSVGTLSANLFMPQDTAVHQKRITELFGRHFATCFTLIYDGFQRVLVCTNKKDSEWTQQRERFLHNLEQFDALFNLPLSEVIRAYN